jgi:hypothetical protein
MASVAAAVSSVPFPPREELAAVAYASNLLKARPHQISIVLRDTEAAPTAADALTPAHGTAEASAYGTAAGNEGGGGASMVEAAAAGMVEAAAAALAPAPAHAGAASGGSAAMRSLMGSGSAMMASASSMLNGGGSLSERARAGKRDGLHVLQNIMPDWDESLEAFTLPFYQRVVLPSKKNVHIVNPDNPDDIVMLFGKRHKSGDGNVTTFSLDYCRPVSALAAMGIALTAFFGSS